MWCRFASAGGPEPRLSAVPTGLDSGPGREPVTLTQITS